MMLNVYTRKKYFVDYAHNGEIYKFGILNGKIRWIYRGRARLDTKSTMKTIGIKRSEFFKMVEEMENNRELLTIDQVKNRRLKAKAVSKKIYNLPEVQAIMSEHYDKMDFGFRIF